MLSDAISILDKIISLLQNKNAREKEFLREYIVQLFSDLSSVHVDYRNSFIEFRILIEDSRVPISDIQHRMSDRKQTLKHIRSKIIALTNELSHRNKGSEELNYFVSELTNYFNLGSGRSSSLHPMITQTWYTTLLDILIHAGKNKAFNRNECQQWSAIFLDEISRRWSAVAVAYAKLVVSITL